MIGKGERLRDSNAGPRQRRQELGWIANPSEGGNTHPTQRCQWQLCLLSEFAQADQPLTCQQARGSGLVEPNPLDQLMVAMAHFGSGEDDCIRTTHSIEGFSQTSERRQAPTKRIRRVDDEQIQIAMQLQMLKS